MSSSPKTMKPGGNLVVNGRGIPTRRVMVNDLNQVPSSYSTTPGGTMFSTTPGGTRIIYDRGFLLQMRASPHSQSPPKNLPFIPGVTNVSPPKVALENGKENEVPQTHCLETIKEVSSPPAGTLTSTEVKESGDEPQFSIEM